MTEEQKTSGEEAGRQQEQEGKPSSGSAFEGIYDRLPDISVKAVDRFIVLCIIALAAVIVIGVLRAQHII
ncbi:MAG: hypothetical protein HFG70_09995 [Hungatella sp.]|nr:hypothetical protein [Hungatella sp.]